LKKRCALGYIGRYIGGYSVEVVFGHLWFEDGGDTVDDV